MKKRSLFLIGFIGLLLSGTTIRCNSSAKLEDRDVTLPDKYKSRYSALIFMSVEDSRKHLASNTINDADREYLKLNDVKHIKRESKDSDTEESNEHFITFLKNSPNEYIVKGEVLDETNRGRLQSIFAYNPKIEEYSLQGEWVEFFVTYNSKGEFVDAMAVGATDERYCSTTSGINFLLIELVAGGESWSEYYKLGSDLKFNSGFKLTDEEHELIDPNTY